MTLSIVDFLNARLAEDEAAAQDAAKDAAGYSHGYPNDPLQAWRLNDEGDLYAEHVFLAGGAYGGGIDEPIGQHLVRHDPARVLREVAAKRAIVNMHYEVTLEYPVCAECETARRYPCRTLKRLAAVYSNHPDYREEWAA